MSSHVTRRNALKYLGVVGISASSLVLSGCGQGEDETAADSDTPSEEESLGRVVYELPYAETEQFTQEFNRASEAGQVIRVIFNGKKRLGEESELLTILRDKDMISNHGELLESLHDSDNAEGREQLLSKIFDDNLIKHKKAEVETRFPSGEVVEPGTVILSLVLLLAIATTVAAAIQISLHGPVCVKVYFTAAGPVIEFAPAYTCQCA